MMQPARRSLARKALPALALAAPVLVARPLGPSGDIPFTQFLPLLGGERPGYSLENRYVRKEGSLVWVDVAVSLRRDAAGTPATVIAILQDISESKRLEEELRKAHARLELAVRGSNITLLEL